MTSCLCCSSVMIVAKPMDHPTFLSMKTVATGLGVVFPHPTTTRFKHPVLGASKLDSYESSSDFVKRTDQAWEIYQQPSPVVCSPCNSKGSVECKWCGGTGFFILGDNMLCQVSNRNTTCVICAGKGSTCCSDCKGTGFRAKWLGQAPHQ